MARRKPDPYVPYADYLALEESSDARWCWLDGKVWAMAGGTPEHARLSANLSGLLFLALRRRPCAAYSADLRIRVRDTRFAFHPDVSVVCGSQDRDAEDPNAVTNPTVLVEVLSKSTERFDRMEKFQHYRRIPTFRDYLLVSQTEPLVQHFRKNEDGTWTLTEARGGDTVHLSSLEVELAVDDIYEGLGFVP